MAYRNIKALAAGLIAAAMLASAGPAAADVIRLKDGRAFEGTVVSETASQVVFQVESQGVKALMKFARRDVSRVDRGAKLEPTPAPTPSTDTPRAARTTDGAVERQPTEYEGLQALVRFRETDRLPVDRELDYDKFEGLIEERDRSHVTNLFGRRLVGATRQRDAVRMTRDDWVRLDQARLQLVEDMHNKSREQDVSRGAARLLLMNCADVIGLINADVTQLQEQLRLEFSRTLDLQTNPKHMAAMFGWDVNLWQYTGRVNADLAAERLKRMTDEGVTALRWLIEYGRTSEAATVSTNIADAYNSLNRPLPEKARLAVWALAGRMTLARRVNDAYVALRSNPDDQDAHRQVALNMACYARDWSAALDHMARVTVPTWSKLAAAGKQTDTAAALFQAGIAMAELADGPADVRTDQFTCPVPVWRGAKWALEEFIRSNRGDSRDRTTAQLQAARLGELIRRAEAGITVLGLSTGHDVRHVVFVIDRSGDMAARLSPAADAVASAISGLPDGMAFQAISFADHVTQFTLDGRAAIRFGDPAVRQAAATWVRGLTAGTARTNNSIGALQAAFEVAGGPPDAIFILTNRPLSEGAAAVVTRLDPQARSRIYALALGQAGAADSLRTLADQSGGGFRLVPDGELGGR